jgi:urease accessory protein UreE
LRSDDDLFDPTPGPRAPITASVTLPIDVRVKSRARVALNDGREAGLMLPRGLLLRGATC